MPHYPSIRDFSKRQPNDSRDTPVFLMDLEAGSTHARGAAGPELIFILTGQIETRRRDGNIQILSTDNFILSTPGDLISLNATEDSTVLVLRLCCERQLYGTLGLPNLSYFRPAEEDKTFFLTMDENVKIFLDGFVPLIRKGFMAEKYHEAKTGELLYILRESYGKTDLATLFYPLLGPEISFKNFVFSTVKKAASVNELADFANMSVTGFRAKFQKIMGESPSDMINRIKADMVRHDLLHSDVPLKEISDKYGFSSIHVFTRFCSRHLGMSPGNLRKSHRISQG